MYKFIIVSIILLFALIWIIKKKKSLIYPSTLIILLYFISAILAYPHIIVNNEKLSLNEEYTSAAVSFLFLLFIFLFPLIRYNEHKINRIFLPGAAFLKLISYIIIIISLLSIFILLPGAIRAFSFINLSDAREVGRQVEEGLLVTIASVSSYFYIIAIILFFIYRAKGTNKFLSFLLLISSTSYIIHVFTYTGRDGVVFWAFSFIATYGFFKNFISKRDSRIIKNILIIFSLVAVPLFWAITRDRFSENPFAGILSYIGQPIPNFCLFLNAEYPVSNGASFPLFRRIIGLEPIYTETSFYGGTNSYVFGTFLKSFITNVDVLGTVLIAIFMSFVFLRFFSNKRNSNFYFYQFFIYFLYFQIFSQGVFYFRHYSIAGNFFIIMSFALFYLFKHLNKYIHLGETVLHKEFINKPQ